MGKKLKSVAAVLAVAAVAGLYATYLQVVGNFHEVVPQAFYRSAQPSIEELAQYKKDHDIQTIINLRGESPSAPWYQEELALSKRLGITHKDFAMKDNEVMNKARAIELIDLMKKAKKPILVHCRAGSDRTGLAAALYLAAIEHADEEDVEWQLSFQYGHVPLPFVSKAYPMDVSFEDLEDWLGYEGS